MSDAPRPFFTTVLAYGQHHRPDKTMTDAIIRAPTKTQHGEVWVPYSILDGPRVGGLHVEGSRGWMP